MTRRSVSLTPPPEDAGRLESFPRSTLQPKTVLWRAVLEDNGPWWFSCSMAGRFDLSQPRGTCYLSTDPLTAVLEVYRAGVLITTEELGRRRLHKLHVPASRSLANLTSRSAAGFGLTLEIHSHPRYDLTQAWASRLRETGAEGLLYLARHDPCPGPCVALFGPAGERATWDPGTRSRLDEPRLIERLWHECRIRVADRPRLDQIPVRG